jgi:hypothetical protein
MEIIVTSTQGLTRKFILIVGDKFRSFAEGKDVLTASQTRALLKEPWIAADHNFVLVPGQGLGDDALSEIRALASRSPHHNRFDLSLLAARSDRASRQLSHKHHSRNTVISAPRHIDAITYELDLLLGDDSELIEDHQTGQHIQGIVLFEAGRQAFLAVTEAFFLPQNGNRYYFVIDKASTSYKRFAFPVSLLLHYRVLNHEVDQRNRHRGQVSLSFLQAGEEVAGMEIGFTAYDETWLATKEAALAAAACEAALNDAARRIKDAKATDQILLEASGDNRGVSDAA